MRTLIFLLFSTIAFSQVQPGGWSFGLGVNFVDYTATLAKNQFGTVQTTLDFKPGEYFNTGNWNLGFPRINATYYWKKNIAIDAAFSLNRIERIGDSGFNSDNDEFISVDLNAEYRLLNSSFLIQPYILAGLGITKAPIVSNVGIALNTGVGLDLWTRGNFGFFTKTMFRYGGADAKLLPHTLHTLGLNYRMSSYRKSRSRGGCLVNKRF
jgi:hypothetical protein